MIRFDELSVVIPYRPASPEREHIFEWTCDRYGKVLPQAELVVGEMTSGQEYFCRAEAINNGVRQANRRWLLIADADVIAFPAAVDRAIAALDGAPRFARVFPYESYHHLSAGSTDLVLRSLPAADPREHLRLEVIASYDNSTSGLIVLATDTFWASGGMDERFVGWGPEDQSWDLAVETLCGPSSRITDWDLYHLFHRVDEGHRQDNPHYPESERLWNQYKQAGGDRARMRALIESTGGWVAEAKAAVDLGYN